jgi:hypothetical protein
MRAITLLVVLSLPASSVAAQDWSSVDGDLDLVLEDALWRPERSEQRAALTLTLTRQGARWSPWVVGYARSYNQADHHGHITKVEQEGDTLRLSIKLRVEPDPYTGGAALAEYELDLRHRPERIEGKWTGKTGGQAGQGEVKGVFHPATLTDHTAPQPGEHPRLLVRKSQIPALRQKAQTPWGQQMIERLKKATDLKSGQAVAQGLLYVLTGEKEYADKARELIDGDWRGWSTTSGVVHEGPARALHTALAYDLVYDTCDEAFRKRINEQLILFLPFFYSGGDQGQFNQNDHSNWSAMFRSGVGMSAMATFDEPWLELPKPIEPALARLRPPVDLKVGRDVPVVKIEGERSWSDWLVAGPFKVGPVGPVPNPAWSASSMVLPLHAMPLEDALSAIGGEAKARPENGTVVGECTFAPLDPKHLITKDAAERVKNPQAAGSIDMASLTRNQALTTTCFYCVVDNPQAGFYRVEMPSRKAIGRVYVAGQVFQNGQVVHLEKGRYPVMARSGLPMVGGWMKCEFKLRLLPVAEPEADAWLKGQREVHQADLAEWQVWQDNKPARGNFWSRHWLSIARQRVANYSNRSMGEIGWNTEGEAYTQHSLRLMLPLAHAYRNVTGRELAPVGHLNSLIAGYLGRTIAGERVRMQSYGCGGGPLGVDNLARGYGLFAPEWRPAALWLWNRTQAAADAGRLKEPVAPIDQLDAVSAVFMFVNYPLDVPERSPADLRGRITVDGRKGGYVFRNRWQDEDDFVAQIFANREFAGGTWPTSEAGDLRISGLGVDWIVRGAGYGHTGSSRKAAHTRLFSSTLLPSDAITKAPMESAVTFHEAGPDGSGIISLNMDNVYSGEAPGPKGEARAQPVRPGARTGYELGIRGMRSFAADYSGLCGAPGLFAVVDRVSGTSGKNTWQLVTDKAHKVAVDAGGFSITAANGASLRGTVVWPAGAKVAMADQSLDHEINYHGGHRNFSFPRTIITFTAGEFFFVILTVQKEAPPQVRTAGEGAGAKATVGGRTVSFDGARIVLEPTREAQRGGQP